MHRILITLFVATAFLCVLLLLITLHVLACSVSVPTRVARDERRLHLSLSLSLFFFTSLLLNRTTGFLFLDFNNRWIHVRFDDLVED